MATLPQELGRPVGLRGLRHYSGILGEEFHRRLRTSPQRYAVYQEMGSNSPLIKSSLQLFVLLMRQVSWSFAPREETIDGQRDAEFAQSVFFEDMRTPWRDVLTEAMSMLQYGWASLEINYKLRRGMTTAPRESSLYTDGMIGLDSLELRGQNTLERWRFDDSGLIEGWEQVDLSVGKRVFLPMEKCVHFVMDPAKGNPEGTSMLRHCVPVYWDVTRWRELLGVGIARDLAGIPIAEVPPEITSDPAYTTVLNGWKDIVRNIRRGEDEGAVIPLYVDPVSGNQLSKFGLLQSAGQRQFDVLAVLQHYERQMMVSLFSDIMLLGHEKVGSFALASSKTNLLSVALGSILDTITHVFNTQLLPRLWQLNGWDRLPPRLEHGDIESVDLAELGQFVAQMSGAGLDVLAFEEEVWRRAGFVTNGDVQ